MIALVSPPPKKIVLAHIPLPTSVTGCGEILPLEKC